MFLFLLTKGKCTIVLNKVLISANKSIFSNLFATYIYMVQFFLQSEGFTLSSKIVDGSKFTYYFKLFEI